jgi:putative PIN family toxin of toxin-antitoxin system
LRVVFDTNIYISAFVIPGGNAEKAYLGAINGDFELYTSVAILTELARKLEEKFGWEKPRIVQLIRSMSDVALVLKTRPCLKVLSDDPDKRILECASKAEAELLVTGDNHLLELEEYGNCKIVKLSPFLTMLQETPTGQQFPSSKPEK